jgi:hypothetical protein
MDMNSIPMENYIATKVLCNKFSIHEAEMQRCLRSIGYNCITNCIGVYVIANISLKHDKKYWVKKTRCQIEIDKKRCNNRQ